jgi:hypothetical protein
LLGVFATEIGRREMWDALSITGFFSDRVAVAAPTGFPDALATFQLAGRQGIGRQLFLSWLRRAPEGVLSMLRENHPDLRPPPKPQRRRREPY